MPVLRSLRVILFASSALASAAAAQNPPPASTPAQTVGVGRRVYTPSDFARFAPRTAYDMLIQVPSFTIANVDTTERGLGQASENVLINGQRIANKTGGAVDQLQRTPAANVERIEIVDAASLGIAGLSGQVANVVLKAESGTKGQFEWRPDVRAHYSKPNLYRGSISYSGKIGKLEYTLTAKDNAGRGAFGGPIMIYDGNHVLRERRFETYHEESELVTFETKLHWDGWGSSVGNLTLGYGPYWDPVHLRDRRSFVDGDTGGRTTVQKLDGWQYDVNGDYEFALGPGRLKLIGLQHRDHEPVVTTQITHLASVPNDDGVRFSRNSHIGETIGRAEYSWKTGKNDWQVSFERAYNFLDQKGGLFILQPNGDFEQVDFPEGTGRAEEVRYESIATFSRPLSTKLDLQVAAGAEISRLDRTDDELPARKFFRPKGSITLGWRPSKNWDLNFKIRRRVGQISFYDFLAQPKLLQDRENAGNPDLVPPQSWDFSTEIGRELGKWGKTRLKVWADLVTDIVDVIPLANHTEGIGNLPHARRMGIESNSTINFDPIGWKGAKVDIQLGMEDTSVRDPLTGAKRPISGISDRYADINLRHDIPGTQIAWGGEASYQHSTKNYFLTEVYRSWEGPWFVSFYVEDKNVMGMTVRLQAGNVFNARHRWTRYIYQDWRDTSPLSTYQVNNQLIGPIFQMQVKGNF